MKSLKIKGKEKNLKIPGTIDEEALMKAKKMYEFDNVVTAPLHGFDSADDYYAKSSAINFIQDIKIPTLLVTAANDPFLSESCYDQTKFKASKHVYFEIPKFGGHVGFTSSGTNGTYWSESRAYEFLTQF